MKNDYAGYLLLLDLDEHCDEQLGYKQAHAGLNFGILVLYLRIIVIDAEKDTRLGFQCITTMIGTKSGT